MRTRVLPAAVVLGAALALSACHSGGSPAAAPTAHRVDLGLPIGPLPTSAAPASPTHAAVRSASPSHAVTTPVTVHATRPVTVHVTSPVTRHVTVHLPVTPPRKPTPVAHPPVPQVSSYEPETCADPHATWPWKDETGMVHDPVCYVDPSGHTVPWPGPEMG